MSESGPGTTDWDMKVRLAADRVLRAVTLRRQAKVAVLASAALSVVAAARPDLLPPDLLALKDILNVGAISALLNDVAKGKAPDDEAIAARMEQLLPSDDALARLATGQDDLLRALTRQHRWQRQMLRLQEADAEAGARLLAGLAEMTGDLAAIRDAIGATATQEQMNDLLRLIADEVLPRLTDATRDRYELSGDFRGAMVNINSTVTIAWPEGRPYSPPPPPAPGELPRPDYLPPGAFLPFDRNATFTGRGEEMLELAAQLLPAADDDRSMPAARRSALITSGIGGVGKTQLAVEFAYRFGRFFHGVHWVSAENPDAIDAAVAKCGRRMRLHPTFGDLSLPDQVALTEAAWAGPEPRLIILDNCEEPGVLARRRPKGGGARVLVTSRNTKWPPEYGAAALAVKPLPRAESLALLAEYVGTPGDGPRTTADLERVAAEVGDLPLALALAGHYLARYRRVTVSDYLAEVRRAEDLVPVGRGAISLTDHELSLRRTFAVSFNKLDKTDPADAAAVALLARAACFAPGEPLPEGLLQAPMSPMSPERGLKALWNRWRDRSKHSSHSLSVDDGLLRLLELGLLERAGADVVRLHRLVGRFVEGALAGEALDATRAAVEEVAQGIFSRVWDLQDPREFIPLTVQLRHVVDMAGQREDAKSIKLINAFGLCLQVSGDYPGARPYLEWALTICERLFGPDHLNTASILNNLGYLLQRMDDLSSARRYYEQTLAIWEVSLGENNENVALAAQNLGVILLAQGDMVGARSYFERDVAIKKSILGIENPDTVLSLINLAVFLDSQNDPSSMLYFEQIFATYEQVDFENLAPDKGATLGRTFDTIGFLISKAGGVVVAKSFFELSLKVRVSSLGHLHPDVAMSLNNLGSTLLNLGVLDEARPYLEMALKVREIVLEPEHKHIAQSLWWLGVLADKENRKEEAQKYFQRSIKILENWYNPEHKFFKDLHRSFTELQSN